MLDVQVLGPVTVRAAGRECDLRGRMQSALFAHLVVARGRPLDPQLLIDELWGDTPPREPLHALQAHVSRLRSVLGTEVDYRHGGYRIDPLIVTTDAARFIALGEQADRRWSDQDLDGAAAVMREALGLWRGPAFVNLPDATVLRAEAARLEEVRAAMLIDRIDVDLARGRRPSVIPELHALVEEQPLVERHWVQLMLALYADGRTMEALDTFNRAADVFAHTLGVDLRSGEPAGELAAVRSALLDRRPVDQLLRWSPAAR